ncbi:MAG: S8/S53 family peptidase, partial [Oligoflexia bacterium]|nr:S8/S53 family peptidase [Oligoflexia bacterium]
KREDDLLKFDDFWGYAGVSLEKLDLRKHYDLLAKMPFDTETVFPDKSKLPENFNPQKLIDAGKNPGLGIRSLHRQGINGQGVAVAIIDQPLLLGHVEYTGNIVYYDAEDLFGIEPQMHASPVASIAIGKNLGVAPKAKLYFFTTPAWKSDNKYYAGALNKIIQLNKSKPLKDRIRVVSISFGGFDEVKNPELWKEAVKEAEKQGILIVTCNMKDFDYRIASLKDNTDPDLPESYERVRWLSQRPVDKDRIFVPGGTRTIASHRGINVYTYERNGGMSWGTPYLAGLAALAYQVDPNITPDKIIAYWKQSATDVKFGRLINPTGFIELVKMKGK